MSAATKDAKERGWRTVAQGLAIDLAVAAVLVLGVAFTTIEWTKTYWIGLGLSLARTLLQAAVSYFMRLLVPPTKASNTP